MKYKKGISYDFYNNISIIIFYTFFISLFDIVQKNNSFKKGHINI